MILEILGKQSPENLSFITADDALHFLGPNSDYVKSNQSSIEKIDFKQEMPETDSRIAGII